MIGIAPLDYYPHLGEAFMQLSKRLQCIADFVLPGDRIVDVGTDHAYIPIWLLQTGRVAAAIATDLRAGPLERARLDAEHAGVADRLQLRLCDGLAGTKAEEVDPVLIAGMGGETILHILAEAPWTKEKRLILQPQTKQEELRSWLGANGYTISDAALAYDTGRIYLVWLVGAGEMPPFSGVDAPLLAHRDALLRPYLDDQIKRLRKRLHGVEAAARPEEALAAELRTQLAALETIYHEVTKWQT